ncbi:MAG: cytochrome c oxidase assembly protein [Gaiellaceae bacterium]
MLAVEYSWTFAPVPVALALVAAALFAQGFVRLRRRAPHRAGWDRPALFAVALACGVLPLVSPLDGVADEYLLSAHMLEHVLIGDVAPMLAIIAVRGPLVFFLLPQRLLRALAGISWLRAALSFLLRPWVTFVLAVGIVAGWHVPAAYDYADLHQNVHDLQHACFVVAGTLVWAQLVDPARRRALTDAGRIFYAWGLFAAGELSTHVILLDSTAHYRPYAEQPVRLLGLSPVADQHWAAAVMSLEQVLVFGMLTLALIRLIPIPGAELPQRADALEQ